MHNDENMKRKGDEPTTRKDLWALETAIREATRKDIGALETGLRKDIGALSTSVDETRKLAHNLAVGQSRTDAQVSGLREEFSSVIRNLESRLVGHIDGFMSKTLKVGSDQFWLIHRMDELEGRVEV